MGHGSRLRVTSRGVSLQAILNFGYEPPLRGHDRERNGQSRQTAPDTDHRDDAGDGPERADDPDRGGDYVVGAVVSADRGVPHVCLAGNRGHRLMRRPPAETPERWEGCPIWSDGDPFHCYLLGRLAERNVRSLENGEMTPASRELPLGTWDRWPTRRAPQAVGDYLGQSSA